MSTKKRTIRRVLAFPGDGNDNDFAIDEGDYHAVRNILFGEMADDRMQAEIQRIVTVESDGERRVCKFHIPNEFSTRLAGALHPSIGALTRLTLLDLNCSDITSLPSSIGRLQNLQKLAITSNKLSSLPAEIGDLVNLNEMDLECCGITSLPSSIGRLKKLEDLNLCCTCYLKSLPDEFGDLTRLRRVNLVGTGIASLNPSIGRLRNLEELRLHSVNRNLSQASLPEEIVNLASSYSLHTFVIMGECFQNCPVVKKLRYAMTRNIARKRIGFRYVSAEKEEQSDEKPKHDSLPPKLWPLVLSDATRAYVPSAGASRGTSIYKDLKIPDAIYQLLVDGRESFLGVLIDRETSRVRN